MIRFKVQEQIERKSLKEGRKITAAEVARAIGVQRAAISKMVRNDDYSTTTKTLNALCEYFECELHDLVAYEKA
ncbi:helix-turn-helix transcriptional regulator [Enterovibrio makurazakiensis]|uniref:helix-turn-helix domain-containing protein n=1 Tax=Enterovibrio makurazakiensis TaxID=2910232 RepID=UPI003D19B1FB